jgi:hypothetical protein
VRFRQLSAALNAAPASIKLFFRDDDAGWGDEHLRALLEVFEAQAAPIDLAVIPHALTREMALELCTRRARGRDRLGFHQHGYRHSNYETEGRKCEFGPSRSAQQQAHDILAGQMRLRALLGNIDPIFTPPWNRCTQATVQAVRASGQKALSRDVTAAPLELGPLDACAVHVDWCKWTHRADPDWAALDQQLAVFVQRGQSTLGIMLHHAVMTDADWAALRELLPLLNAHRRAQLCLMRELIQLKKSSIGANAVARA